MIKNTIKNRINVKDIEINIITDKSDDYISLTDLARYHNRDLPQQVIANWMRLYNTISFLSIWEEINNPDFKP
ncbi:MAG: KilA-N domain-containing protein, partial [Bifidobacteriaceae bacterium]|nr:KilA-N domain-containing protein [Bifidobacteriaceae bacterium]